MAKVLPENRNKNRRAGVIVTKQMNGEWFVLGLRVYGSYDLPKGGAESFETDLAAALRENEEEEGITALDFRWGLKTTRARHVTLFIAETFENPTIRPNPETGEYEHHDAVWLTFKEASMKMHPYLRPTILWAQNIVEEV